MALDKGRFPTDFAPSRRWVRERTLSDLFEGRRQLIVYGNFRNDKNIESESQLHDEPFVMNRIRSLFFLFSLTMLPALYAERIDHRNFAIDVCYPNPNSIRLAEVRTKTYWAKHASRFGPDPRFLAVQTSKVFPSEVQDLWPKLINSETTGSFFSHGRRNS